MSTEGQRSAWENPAVVFVGPSQVAMEERGGLTPNPDEVVVKNHCSLISTGTELTLLEGAEDADSVWTQITQFPNRPGYCSCGQVVAAGEGVDSTLVGQRVSVSAWQSHARYMTAPVAALRLVTEAISDEEAAFSTIAEIVLNGIRRSEIALGEVVVVYGLGLLGQLAVRFSRLCGARRVFAVDVSEPRLAMLPADERIVRVNAANDDALALIREQTDGEMADVAFELTANAALVPDELRSLRHGGRFVVLSSPRGKTSLDLHDLCCWPSIRIIGAHVSSSPPAANQLTPWTQVRHAQLFFDLVASGELSLDGLITHRAPYHEAPELYAMLLRDRSAAMGVVLDWTA